MNILIIGTGITGCTLARLLAEERNHIAIIDKNPFIGGVCYDYLSDDESCYVHKFGPHIFHTLNEDVWMFVNQFDDFIEYRHSYMAYSHNDYYPFPINLHTISKVFRQNVYTKEDAIKLMKKESKTFSNPQNFEEAAINDIGERLYDMFIKDYTEKQWKCKASELPVETYNRIKIRYNFNDDCFQNQFQGMPKHGYIQLFLNILNHKNIDVKLNEDFFKMQNIDGYDLIIYTGHIPNVRHRSTRFVHHTGSSLDYPVVNYSGKEEKTRTTDFNILHKISDSNVHHLCDEIPIEESDDSCLYPVNTEEGIASYNNRKNELLSKYKNLKLCGRMAEYKYLDMDAAILNAMNFTKEIFR